MRSTPMTLVSRCLVGAVALMVSLSCGRGSSPPRAADEELRSPARKPPGTCPEDGGWFKTTLQLSKQPGPAHRRLKNGTQELDCWWQWKPLPLRTYWEGHGSWEVCNACDFDVTVRIANWQDPAVLRACRATVVGADNTLTIDVPTGNTATAECDTVIEPPGVPQTSRFTYEVAGRMKASAGPLVDVDPELEIERRGGGGGGPERAPQPQPPR